MRNGYVTTKDGLIREQAQMIVQKDKVIAKLRGRILKLEQLLNHDLKVQTVEYRRIMHKLDAHEQPILETISQLCKQRKRSANYAEIVKAYNAKNPFVKPVTIRRRVRRLREKGLLVKEGTDRFYPAITVENGRKNEENGRTKEEVMDS